MKILIADNHWLIRAGLSHLFHQEIPASEILEAANYEEMSDVITNNDGIELIMLDVFLPGRRELGGLREVHYRLPSVPIVVLSELENKQEMMHAIEYGAVGYIPKSSNGSEILRIVNLLLEGHICMPKTVAQCAKLPPDSGVPRPSMSRDEVPTKIVGPRGPRFTRRQQDVLYWLAKGLSNADIAEKLNLSDHTVRINIRTILRELNVKNRTQAAIFALEHLNTDLDYLNTDRK